MRKKSSNLDLIKENVSGIQLYKINHFRRSVKLFLHICHTYYAGDKFYDTEEKYNLHFEFCLRKFMSEYSDCDNFINKWNTNSLLSDNGFEDFKRSLKVYTKHFYYLQQNKNDINLLYNLVDDFFDPMRMIPSESQNICENLVKLYK